MHSCSALLVSCIDFRIQPAVEAWARRNLGERNYDRAAVAGGVKDFPVILMNHEDCGAYGPEGTEAKHRQDLLSASSAVTSKYPQLAVETYYVMLSGQLQTVRI